MATTPNPSTTEWVPLWDLNGIPVSSTGPHHITHEPGGTDAIQNAAWTNLPNIFTENQTIKKTGYGQLIVQDPSVNIKMHLQAAAGSGWISNNLYNDGTNWRLDDLTGPASMIYFNAGITNFYRADSATNPALLIRTIGIDPIGFVTIEGNTLITKIRPDIQLQYTGDVSKTHITRHIPNAMMIGDNISFDGSNWNRDNTAIPGANIILYSGTTYFRNITAPGINPATLIDTLRIDATGVVTSAAGNIRVTSTRPMIEVQYPGNPVVARIGQVVVDNRIDIMSNLYYDGSAWLSDNTAQPSLLYVQQVGEHTFYTLTAGTGPRTPIQQFRVGAATASFAVPLNVPAGLGSTPLNASNITSGTIPDARLSSNVALKNIDNQFVAQTFGSYSVIQGSNSVLYFRDTAAPVNLSVWRILSYADGNIHLESLNDALNVVNGRINFIRDGSFQALGGLNATPLNASYLTSGTIPIARYQTSGWFYPVVGGSGGESGQDYKYQQGYWVRVGDVYHVWAYTQFRGPGGGPGVGGAPDGHVGARGNIVGNLQLKGIPTCGNPPGAPPSQWPPYATMSAPFASGGVPYYTNQQPGDTVGMYCYTAATLNYAFMYRLRPNSNNAVAMTTNDINDDSQFMFYLFYFAA